MEIKFFANNFLFLSILLLSPLLQASEVLLIQDVLKNSKHQDRPLLKKIASRLIGLNNGGSGTILDTNSSGQALIFTAKHVAAKDFNELVGGLSFSVDEFDFIVDGTYYGINPYQATVNYNGSQFLAYKILVPQTTPQEVDKYKGERPENDYSVVLASGAQIENSDTYVIYSELEKIPFPTLYSEQVRIANPQTGENVILLGKPESKNQQPAYTKGQVLSPNQAKELLENSADIIERSVPFDPQIEFVVNASASSGFSGGGVFNNKGEYLGVIIRGDIVAGKFTRVLRTQFVIERANKKFEESLVKHPELRELTDGTLLSIQ